MEQLQFSIQATPGITQKTRDLALRALEKGGANEVVQRKFFMDRCDAIAPLKFLVYQAEDSYRISLFDHSEFFKSQIQDDDIGRENLLGAGRLSAAEARSFEWDEEFLDSSEIDMALVIDFERALVYNNPIDEKFGQGFAEKLLQLIEVEIKKWRMSIFKQVLPKKSS